MNKESNDRKEMKKNEKFKVFLSLAELANCQQIFS